MKTFLASLLFACLCVPALASAQPYDPPPFCEHPYPVCGITQYASKNDRCEEPACKSLSLPPAPARVYCTYMTNGYDCEVWPRGPEHTYTFAVSGPISITDAGPTYQSNVWVQCQAPYRPGGVLSVTVYSPAGMASQTKNVQLSCRNQLEH